MFVNVVQNKALQGELLQVCTRLQEHEKAIENFKRSNNCLFYLLINCSPCVLPHDLHVYGVLFKH